MTSSRKIRIKQNFLLSKYGHFIKKLCVHFEPLLGQESVYVYQNLRIEKEGISGKQSEYKTSNWNKTDLHHGI